MYLNLRRNKMKMEGYVIMNTYEEHSQCVIVTELASDNFFMSLNKAKKSLVEIVRQEIIQIFYSNDINENQMEEALLKIEKDLSYYTFKKINTVDYLECYLRDNKVTKYLFNPYVGSYGYHIKKMNIISE